MDLTLDDTTGIRLSLNSDVVMIENGYMFGNIS